MPPGAAAGIALPDTMPTTTSFRSIGFVTGLRVMPRTESAPDVALYVTCVPTAPPAERNPSAAASLSLSTISFAVSERGRRPALSTGSALDERSGGSETRAPDGAGGGVAAAAGAAVMDPFAKVPLIATWPQAALTCCCAASVPSVAPSKAAVL